MCKAIKDILNVLGGKAVQHFVFDIPEEHPNPYIIEVEFTGRWLELDYTIMNTLGFRHTTYTNKKERLYNSETKEIEIFFDRYHSVVGNKIYVRGKNITHLIIDGEQFI